MGQIVLILSLFGLALPEGQAKLLSWSQLKGFFCSTPEPELPEIEPLTIRSKNGQLYTIDAARFVAVRAAEEIENKLICRNDEYADISLSPEALEKFLKTRKRILKRVVHLIVKGKKGIKHFIAYHKRNGTALIPPFEIQIDSHLVPTEAKDVTEDQVHQFIEQMLSGLDRFLWNHSHLLSSSKKEYSIDGGLVFFVGLPGRFAFGFNTRIGFYQRPDGRREIYFDFQKGAKAFIPSYAFSLNGAATAWYTSETPSPEKEVESSSPKPKYKKENFDWYYLPVGAGWTHGDNRVGFVLSYGLAAHGLLGLYYPALALTAAIPTPAIFQMKCRRFSFQLPRWFNKTPAPPDQMTVDKDCSEPPCGLILRVSKNNGDSIPP